MALRVPNSRRQGTTNGYLRTMNTLLADLVPQKSCSLCALSTACQDSLELRGAGGTAWFLARVRVRTQSRRNSLYEQQMTPEMTIPRETPKMSPSIIVRASSLMAALPSGVGEPVTPVSSPTLVGENASSCMMVDGQQLVGVLVCLDRSGGKPR